jgi:hypothetical protein
VPANHESTRIGGYAARRGGESIGELNAAQASQQAGPHNTTIAGHVHHLSVTLALSHTTWDEDALGVAFGAIAHTAYHLGAIRQRLTPRGRNP